MSCNRYVVSKLSVCIIIASLSFSPARALLSSPLVHLPYPSRVYLWIPIQPSLRCCFLAAYILFWRKIFTIGRYNLVHYTSSLRLAELIVDSFRVSWSIRRRPGDFARLQTNLGEGPPASEVSIC
ncbi:hypothetical protein N656DRAFT_366494 [Canariomyces notabilis]|uniref:Uncharacterized protein n=1 Tax=Canariomyces notabilis TaxID=2074819 RepID=A0AAN6T9M8_9PEZI|nr:hypothetical protein N656DRAFT_366494 [Canariomyces arenarius]